MSRISTVIDIKDGKIVQNMFGELINSMFDGRYLISFMNLNPQSNIDTYRRLYFLKIDAIAKEVGETRYDVHSLVKEHILRELSDKADMFVSNTEGLSTKSLTEEGWIAFIEALDIWAFVNYNVILN